MLALYAVLGTTKFEKIAVSHVADMNMLGWEYLVHIPDYVRFSNNETKGNIALRWTDPGLPASKREARIVIVRPELEDLKAYRQLSPTTIHHVCLYYGLIKYPIRSIAHPTASIANAHQENPELMKELGFKMITPFWMLK